MLVARQQSLASRTCGHTGALLLACGLFVIAAAFALAKPGLPPRGGAFFKAPWAPHQKPPSPHIAFMLIDDLGWSDTEFGGSGDADFGLISTPTMKALQPDSIKFNRQYAYAWCAPSRSALLSGRLPVHVNVNHSNPMAYIRSDPLSSGEGIPAGMTTIASKLKQAGYATHYNGKWGVGFTWKEQHPTARGFDSFFGYLHDSVNFWDQKLDNHSIEVPGGCEKAFRDLDPPNWDMATDLLKNDGPARGLNGTEWVDYLFLDESLRIIDGHDPSTPLFLFHSFHSIHAPLNAPAELYVGPYAPAPCDDMRACFKRLPLGQVERRSYAAMVTWTDSAIGDIVSAFQSKGMWQDTLMIVSSDNGGPQYMSPVGYQLWGSGNNLPLRGGKASEFEGGIRVNSFATGGMIPTQMRGTQTDALIHFADWYATFCALAGVDPSDEVAVQNGLPDIDSINQWPVLSGEGGGSSEHGPRSEIQLSPATLIEGNWKLLTGSDPGSINEHTVPGYVPFAEYAVGYVTLYPMLHDYHGAVAATWDALCPMVKGAQRKYSEQMPALMEKFKESHLAEMAKAKLGAYYASVKSRPPTNMTRIKEILFPQGPCPKGYDCRAGCLFNLAVDPNEQTNVAELYPDVHARMMAKHANLSKAWTKEKPWGVFNPIRNGADPRAAGTADECSDAPGSANPCTDLDKCEEFVYGTGFYSWAAEA